VEFDGHDDEMLLESIALTRAMKDGGLDLLDVSFGFNVQSSIPWERPALLVEVAAQLRREAQLPVATSWNIFTPERADNLIRDERIDLVMLGKPMLANPHWPYHAAKALGIDRPAWTLPAPYAHWLARYGGAWK
jgi:2,4-dienoyl-CoA reductase-like NADH-dependent reductase (Old Yellow Enzyme family)